MNASVLLLHGIWMRKHITARLGSRLRAAGFQVIALNYPSVLGAFHDHHTRIDRALADVDPATLHFVGHSLGGLVVLDYLTQRPGLYADARVVCLGSPLCGSEMAQRLRRVRLDTLGLGRAREPLLNGLEAWRGAQSVGVIAGDMPIGWNLLLGRLPRPNDGSVAVAETRLPGISAHALVHASHTGLLFSPTAADLTLRFLREGRFEVGG